MLVAVFATKPGDPALRQPGCDVLDPLVELLPPGSPETQAAVIAARLAHRRLDGVHGYFAHQPAAVAAAAAAVLGLPYGFSVHALDVRKVPERDLAARVAGAAAVLSCNADAASAIHAVGGRAQLVPHGVDLTRFTTTTRPDGSVLSLLTVGRLVEKKGFDVLVDAMALVDRPFHLRIVGDGPERARLEKLIANRGLGHCIELVGRRTHDQLPALYAGADAVVVPSVVDHTGDRDGLPNVVLEAMASGRAVIATDVGSVTSAVRHGVSGLVVPPRRTAALAGAITKLATERALLGRLGAAGRAEAQARFELGQCTGELCRRLERSYG